MIDSSDAGSELKAEFDNLEQSLALEYGDPTHRYNTCNGGAGCFSDDTWMRALFRKNQRLNSFWLSTKVHPVQNVLLETKAVSLNQGYVSCSIEFEGWAAFHQDQIF
jgi:hypothetical protein